MNESFLSPHQLVDRAFLPANNYLLHLVADKLQPQKTDNLIAILESKRGGTNESDNDIEVRESVSLPKRPLVKRISSIAWSGSMRVIDTVTGEFSRSLREPFITTSLLSINLASHLSNLSAKIRTSNTRLDIKNQAKKVFNNPSRDEEAKTVLTDLHQVIKSGDESGFEKIKKELGGEYESYHVALVRIANNSSKITSLDKIAYRVADASIKLLAAGEIAKIGSKYSEGLSTGDMESQNAYINEAERLGVSMDSVILKDPNMARNLGRSAAWWGVYGKIIEATGVPLQAGLTALFVFNPEMNDFIANNYLAVDSAAILSTGALYWWRSRQEIAAIREYGYNPDFLQTLSVVTTSSVDENGELRRNIERSVYGVDAFSIGRVQLQYAIGPYLMAKFPEQIPVFALDFMNRFVDVSQSSGFSEHVLAAALTTNIFDMVYHGGFNWAFRKGLLNKFFDHNSSSSTVKSET